MPSLKSWCGAQYSTATSLPPVPAVLRDSGQTPWAHTRVLSSTFRWPTCSLGGRERPADEGSSTSGRPGNRPEVMTALAASPRDYTQQLADARGRRSARRSGAHNPTKLGAYAERDIDRGDETA